MDKLKIFFDKLYSVCMHAMLIPFFATTSGKQTIQNTDFVFVFPDQKTSLGALPFKIPVLENIATEGLLIEDIPQEAKGETGFFSSMDELKSTAPLPLYSLSLDQFKIKYLGAYVTSFQNVGKVWLVRQLYSDDNGGEISIDTIPIMSHPIPVAAAVVPRKLADENAYLDDDDYLLVSPEKIDTTPSPGIIQNYGVGYFLMWIENNLLYVINNIQVSMANGSIDPETLLKLLIKM